MFYLKNYDPVLKICEKEVIMKNLTGNKEGDKQHEGT